MCFGNSQTSQQTQTSNPDPRLVASAVNAENFASNIASKPFQAYTGNQVADFGSLQGKSFGLADATSSQSTPYVSQAQDYFGAAGGAPAGSVSPERISQNMSPYMNRYVMDALAPQLQQQDVQFAQQNKGVDAAATMAGAFGDTGWGTLRGTTTQAQDTARQGLIGQAYNSAFNTAIGAGAQDVATNLQGQTTNAQLQEQEHQRQMAAGQQFEGLGQYDLGQQTQRAQLANTFGQQQTGQQQAQLNALYNQWLMGQQYPFQQAQLLNQSVTASGAAMPRTTTTTNTAPNNAGWALAGTIGGAALGTAFGMPTVGASLGGAVGGGLGNMFGSNSADASRAV